MFSICHFDIERIKNPLHCCVKLEEASGGRAWNSFKKHLSTPTQKGFQDGKIWYLSSPTYVQHINLILFPFIIRSTQVINAPWINMRSKTRAPSNTTLAWPKWNSLRCACGCDSQITTATTPCSRIRVGFGNWWTRENKWNLLIYRIERCWNAVCQSENLVHEKNVPFPYIKRRISWSLDASENETFVIWFCRAHSADNNLGKRCHCRCSVHQLNAHKAFASHYKHSLRALSGKYLHANQFHSGNNNIW